MSEKAVELDSTHERGPELLRLVQCLETSGARAVEAFSYAGTQYLAIAQFARDVPGRAAQINGGDSDVDTLIFRWQDGQFVEHQRLSVAGGEDVEFFRISDRAFLASASLRTGADPYNLNSHSTLFEFVNGRFMPFQTFPTFAAKQWKHFKIGDRHFLALAQGVMIDGVSPVHSPQSCLFEWDGSRFAHFQDVPSAWGYNWEFFEVGGQLLLGYADHIEPSRLLYWNGARFENFQYLDGRSGRALRFFETEDNCWLAFAKLHEESLLYRWADNRFTRQQTLSGPGGREFEWFENAGTGYLVQVNFIHGSREAPQPALRSIVHEYANRMFAVVDTFSTLGGTDATAFRVENQQYLAVSNSLTADVRFRVDSNIYRVSAPNPKQSPES
jgi:EPTP domain